MKARKLLLSLVSLFVLNTIQVSLNRNVGPTNFAVAEIQKDVKSENGEHTLYPVEASGIIYRNKELLIVSDEDDGTYFRYAINKITPTEPIVIEGPSLTRVSLPIGPLAADLEEIDVLADGRVVVLSERLRMILSESGRVLEYDDPFAEIGERGLEGMAIQHLSNGFSRVAALWEGGYFLKKELSSVMGSVLANRSFDPMIVFYDLEAGAKDKRQKMKDSKPGDIIILEVPWPAGREPSAQRFRAPDLLWHTSKNGEGFIVLLNSQSAEPIEFKYLWLQRFTMDGKPFGQPLDIDAVVPEKLKGLNWEGMSWYEEDKSILLIDDTSKKRQSGPPFVFLLALPEDWR